MARLTDDTKQKILADFHTGKSQNYLAKKYEVSPATINKLCKGVEPKHIETVNALTAINTALSEESEYEVNAIHREVEERTKHIQFFNNAALKNVQAAVRKIGEQTSQAEHRMLAETILKGRETVLGKTPDTAIQINNENSSKHPSLNVILNK